MKQHDTIPTLDQGALVELSEVLKLMGEPNRLRILITCLDKPVCVSDIVARLDLSQSLVSHHLRLLRATRLLKVKRQGRQMFYSIDDAHIRCVLIDLMGHVAEEVPSDGEPHNE